MNVSKKELKKRFELGVGGQAVIEGVMMRCKDKVSIAVLKPNKKISIKKDKINTLTKKKPFSLPFFRGVIILFETLIFGIKALNYSANESTDNEDEKLSSWEIFSTVVFSLLLALGLFLILPLYLTHLTATKGILFNFIDGLVRIAIFIAYIYVISLMSDVKRIFQFHGAEHKAVACFEAGEKVTPKNVKKYTTVHKRCGTTFILIVLIISVFVFSLIVSDSFWVKLAGRIILMPLIAGAAYELLKLGARTDNILMRILVAPGLWVQKMTTKEPDEEQIKVACKALNAVVKS